MGNISRLSILKIAICLVLAKTLMSSSVCAANYPLIIDEHRANSSSAIYSTNATAELSTAARWRVVELTPVISKPNRLGIGDTLTLNLFPDKIFTACVDGVTTNVNGTLTVRARIVDYPLACAVFTTTDNQSLVKIDIPEENESYNIQTLSSGKHFLSAINTSSPDELEGAPSPIPPVGAVINDYSISSAASNDPLDPATVDVMILYTPLARAWADASGGGIANVVAQAMAKSQLACDNSNTMLTLRLVYSGEIAYTESGSSFTDLQRLTNKTDGIMNEVHTLRDQCGADLVTLLEKVEDTGGLGWALSSTNGLADYAFNLCRVQQSGSTFTVIHEQGHNMGCGHHKSQTTQPGPGLFGYSAGWRWIGSNGSKYCDVMTYESGIYFADGQTHVRVGYWSNPSITHQGVATGDNANGDNARTLREMKNVIAAYRASVCIPPSIASDPISQTTCPGHSITFMVTASGTAALSYQWRKDGSNIGTNSPSLVINNVDTSDVGSYDCVVSNSYGTAISDAALLEIDGTAPTITNVTNVTTSGVYMSGQTTGAFNVTFSENVTVTGTPQLVLDLGKGANNPKVNYLSGSGTPTLTFAAYTVLDGDTSSDLCYYPSTGTGVVYLNSATIMDAAGNAATLDAPASVEEHSLSYNCDIEIDTAVPTIHSIVRKTPLGQNCNSSSVVWTVTFNETIDASSVSNDDFTLTDVDGTIGGESISDVTPTTGIATTFDVTASTGSNAGTLRLDVSGATATINDLAGNAVAADYFDGETYIIDKAPPTVSIADPSASLTKSSSVTYIITYTGADSIALTANDVTLNKTGTANGMIEVSGTGNTSRTVTISSITGDGTLGISIGAETASDSAGNNAAATGPGATFTVDNTSPTLSISSPSSSRTHSGPITYTATYSGADVINLDKEDVRLNRTGTANGTLGVSGTGTSARTITISNITGDGTLGFSIGLGSASDNAGNAASASASSPTFSVDNAPPTLGSVTPNSGSAFTGKWVTFTASYSDTNGSSDLSTCSMLINNAIVNARGMHVFYERASNTLYMKNNAGVIVGGVTQGTVGTIQTENAILDTAGTTVTASGNTLTINWRVQFKPTMAAKPCNIYLTASDMSGLVCQWTDKGDVTPIINAPPTLGSVTPSSGTEFVNKWITFTATYSDINGSSDFSTCSMLINNAIVNARGMHVFFDRTSNRLYMKNNAGVIVGGVTQGTVGTIQTENAILDTAGTTVTASGNTLTINWRVQFKTTMAAKACNIYLTASDMSGLVCQWTDKGDVTPVINATPTLGSVTPSSGTESINKWVTFTATYSDINGSSDLSTCSMLINNALVNAGGMHVFYDRASDKLYMKNNAGVIVGGLPRGTIGAIQTENAILDTAGTAVTAVGNIITISWRIQFKTTMAAKACNVYLTASDMSGLVCPWTKKGEFKPSVSSSLKLSPPSTHTQDSQISHSSQTR